MCAEAIFIIWAITLGRRDKLISNFTGTNQYAREP